MFIFEHILNRFSIYFISRFKINIFLHDWLFDLKECVFHPKRTIYVIKAKHIPRLYIHLINRFKSLKRF